MSSDYGSLAALFALLAGFIVIFAVVGIVLYILYGIGLMTMAKNKGIANPWLAFVPFASAWLLGQVVGEVKIGSITIDAKTLPLVLVLGQFVSIVPVIGSIAALVYLVFIFIVYFNLYKQYKPGSETLYIILSVIFSFLMPVFIFILRNNTPTVEVTEEF